MVYLGKPSKGCQMCRTRRIKCDETKPTCTQCQKSRRQCPGYKDDFDLMFRNETQATEKRARRAVNTKRVHTHITIPNNYARLTNVNGPYEEPTSSVMEIYSHQAPASRVSVTQSLSISVEEQAPCYFMSNFVLNPKTESSRGYFDFLAPMIKHETPDSHLSLAFSAVALASLANRPQAKGSPLINRAIGLYTKALGSINSALQNPAQQKTDQTLAAIMMLGFFETVTSERTNIMAWGSHISGAVQLIKMRGKKQFRTKIGHALFVAIRNQMIIHCLSASKAPMGDMEWWISDAAKDETGTFVTKLNLQVAELRAEANTLASYPRTPENFPKAHSLIKRAQAMEQEYQTWEDSLPDNWRVKTVAWVDNVPGGDIRRADVCPGKVDMYDDIWIANVYNHARVSRLFVAGVIVRCAAWLCYPVDYRTTPEYATSARLCVDIISDVIGSIPYHLGWRLSQQGDLTPGDFTGFSTGKDDLTSAKALGGFFCIWPLFCVSCLDYTSDSQRQWIQGRLNWISDTMGLNQARVLSTFQLRLPSMNIRRDNLGHSPPSATTSSTSGPSAALLASYQAKAAAMAKSGQQITPAMIAAYIASMQPAGAAPAMASAAPVVDPLHTLQREAWERERKSLLSKAGNGSENNVERILALYLAV